MTEVRLSTVILTIKRIDYKKPNAKHCMIV